MGKDPCDDYRNQEDHFFSSVSGGTCRRCGGEAHLRCSCGEPPEPSHCQRAGGMISAKHPTEPCRQSGGGVLFIYK